MDFYEKLRANYYGSNNYKFVTLSQAKNDPALMAERDRYYSDQNRMHYEFQQDAFTELGITGHPKADALFSIAWEQSHSSGYQAIFDTMEDLVVLIK